jgi:hypothetical protein
MLKKERHGSGNIFLAGNGTLYMRRIGKKTSGGNDKGD